MEPISLAVLTAAATTLATKAAEGFAGEAGKDLWGRVKATLGWSTEPAKQELAPKLAERFNSDEATARKVLELLKENQTAETAVVQQLVGQIQNQSGKVVVMGPQTAGKDINNTLTF